MLRSARVQTTLPARDVDALRPFYEDVLGFEPYAIRPAAVIYEAGAGTRFVISRSGVASAGSHTQMTFVVDDIETAVRELEAQSVAFEAYEMPKTVGGIATLPAGRAAWFKDPAGNLLGIIQFDDPV